MTGHSLGTAEPPASIAPDALKLRRSRNRRLAAHVADHDRLLYRPTVSGGGRSGMERIDLVVVPTSRPWSQSQQSIERAVRLAAECDALVLVLASQKADLAHVVPADSQEWRRVLVLNLTRGTRKRWRPALPLLATDGHPLSVASLAPAWDTAHKRNLGILVAAAVDAGTVLFLDDDLLPQPDGGLIDRAELNRAVGQLRAGVVAAGGWVLRDFPDNSVVCHARRLAGEVQGIFVGGAAFLLKIDERTGFFPRIYNEDWLFQWPYLSSGDVTSPGRGLALFGDVRQKPYDPFRTERAKREELGDILAEGIYQLVDQSAETREALSSSPAYWAGVIEERGRMIRRVMDRLELTAADRRTVLRQRRQRDWGRRAVPSVLVPTARGVWRWWHSLEDASSRQAAQKALRAALQQHSVAAPGGLPWAFADWVRTWREDLEVWRSHLAAPPKDRIRGLLSDESVAVWTGDTAADRLQVTDRKSGFGTAAVSALSSPGPESAADSDPCLGSIPETEEVLATTQSA